MKTIQEEINDLIQYTMVSPRIGKIFKMMLHRIELLEHQLDQLTRQCHGTVREKVVPPKGP